ncbi:MAG: DoxX family protein [Bacteroidetes bacterium]|nr:MAG: DoxX family protein [Bacteroidota bacterium]
MNESNHIDKWSPWAQRMQSILRIVASAMYILAGTMKIFAFPEGMPPDGSTAEVMSQIWIGGVLEIVCGGLLLPGLFTRPAAFLMAGQMAVAYFQFHAPQGFFPTMNGGVSAVLYCFIWLYFWAAGAGPWSVDALRKKGSGVE